jgi:hypothetical protein
MPALTRKVQISLSSEQYKKLHAASKKKGISIPALIREAVTQLYLQAGPAEERLKAVRRMASMDLPVAGWEQMERESMVTPDA